MALVAAFWIVTRAWGCASDTAHAFASGYDLRANDGLVQVLAEIERHVGLDRLRVIHANDSKVGLGSAVDRHENIGKGNIGRAGFRAILAEPSVRRCSVVVETPGTHETHREDIATLRELAA